MSEKKKPIPIRLTEEQADSLDRIAEQLSSNKAQLVRWSVEALLSHIEENDGKLSLPFRYPSDAAAAPGKSSKKDS